MTIEVLCNIAGWDFNKQKVLAPKDLKAAYWIVKQLFPKNKSFRAGSVFINGNGKDLDIVIRGDFQLVNEAVSLGFEEQGVEYAGVSSFTSLRYGYINLIVIKTSAEFRGFFIASRLCKRLAKAWDCQVPKDQRVLIHEEIRKLTSERINDNMDEEYVRAEVVLEHPKAPEIVFRGL